MSDSDLSVVIGCMMFYRAHGPRTTVSHCLYMNVLWAEQLTLSKRIDSYNYFQILMVIIHPVVNGICDKIDSNYLFVCNFCFIGQNYVVNCMVYIIIIYVFV